MSDQPMTPLIEAMTEAFVRALTRRELQRKRPTAPLPEGREGESIVVACMTGNTGAVALARWSSSTLEMEGWHSDYDFFHAGTTGYRWAYVTRVE